MRPFFLFLLSLGSCMACDPTVFDGLEQDAPVVVITTPDSGTAGAFGTVVVAYEARLHDTNVSRFAASGGAGSSFHVFFGFEGEGPDAVPRFDEGTSLAACDMNECMPGIGASLAPFPEWLGPGDGVYHGCVAAAGSSGQIQVRCEDQLPNFQTVTGPSDEGLGAAAAGIAWPQHRAGVALIGAPGAASGDGAVYRLPNGGAPPIRVPLDSAMAPAGGAIGTAIALVPLSERAIAFAARAAYSGPTQRVIVGTLDIDDDAVTTVTIHACLAGERGFGGALVWGDLDADDDAELVVGRGEEASTPEIDVYEGSALLASSADCSAGSTQPTPQVTIECSDVVAPDAPIACPAPGFGSALAIGDFDGDTVGDLVVGAPGASVEGRGNAGALVVIAGDGAGLSSLGDRSAVLTHTSQSAGDRLGTAVAALRGRDRHEIVAGMPGRARLAVFLCSGISGDRPSDVTDGQRGCL